MYLWGIIHEKSRQVTHTVSFQHTEILYPSLPGLEVEVKYQGRATINQDTEGWEYSHDIISLYVSVNGSAWEAAEIPPADSTDGNRFLAPLRESARRNLRKMQEPVESKYSHAHNFPPFKPSHDE